MTVKEAKNELMVLKTYAKDLESVEEELEKYRTIATKMTQSFEPINVQTTAKNRLEEAVIKIEDYTSRLSKLVLELMDYKARCLEIVEQIKLPTLRSVLINYFFLNNTLERTAEKMGHSYQWTYDLYVSALEEYCKVHDSFR